MRSKTFLYISLSVDILIVISKFAAAIVTGSSSMISEGIHSVIDAISQLLLIWGISSSKRQPDATRPFGYGKELYFWSFIVSLIIFCLGGCISIYEGILRVKKPWVESNPFWNYIVLIGAFLFTLISMVAALKAFNKQRGAMPFWKAIMSNKDPSTSIVLLGDFGDLLGLIVAFFGIYLGRMFHNPYFDGIASIIIGAILVVISGQLIQESKSLLVGHSTTRKNLKRVVALAEADKSVVKVKKHLSSYMAPDEMILVLNTIFKDDLTTRQIIEAIERISRNIQTEFPQMKQIFIEPVENN
jgi:cation diffusion facilitator family transporter